MLICRVCGDSDQETFDYNHPIFPGKDESWENIYCKSCISVSHYKLSGQYQDYVEEYRTPSGYLVSTKPPIDPWSQVTYDRGLNIINLFENKGIKIDENLLDIGGYNGFTALSIVKKYGIKGAVADFDENGLAIARAFGLNPINLSSESIKYKEYKNYLLIHVLEHIPDPLKFLCELASEVGEDGVIYIEVPNVFGFPLRDPAHLTSFSMTGLIKILDLAGLHILDKGFTTTPGSADKYGYFYRSNIENLYVICTSGRGLSKIEAKNMSKQAFIRNLDRSYNMVSLKYLAPRFIGEVIRYSLLFLATGFSALFSYSYGRIFMNFLKSTFKKNWRSK
jgi:hypothetical protein